MLPDQALAKNKLQGIRKEANNHQIQMEDLVTNLSQSDALDSSKIQEMARETEQKASPHLFLIFHRIYLTAHSQLTYDEVQGLYVLI